MAIERFIAILTSPPTSVYVRGNFIINLYIHYGQNWSIETKSYFPSTYGTSIGTNIFTTTFAVYVRIYSRRIYPLFLQGNRNGGGT